MLPNFFLFNKRLPHEQKKAKNKKKGEIRVQNGWQVDK